MDTKESGNKPRGWLRQLPAHLQGYQVSLPQSLMPHTAPHQDDDLGASAQQLKSLSLQTSSATTDGQLQLAVGHPSSYLPAVNEVNQWNLASQAKAPPGTSTEVGRPPSLSPSETSETSSQGYEATGFTNASSPPASPAITQDNFSFKTEETTQAIQLIQSAVFPASTPSVALLPEVVTPGTSSFSQGERDILTRSLPVTLTSTIHSGVGINQLTSAMTSAPALYQPAIQWLFQMSHTAVVQLFPCQSCICPLLLLQLIPSIHRLQL